MLQSQQSMDMLQSQQPPSGGPGLPPGSGRRRPASPRPSRPQEIYDAAVADLREAQRHSGEGAGAGQYPEQPQRTRSFSRRSSGGLKAAIAEASAEANEMMGMLRVSGSSTGWHSRDEANGEGGEPHHQQKQRRGRNPSPKQLRRDPSPQGLRRNPSPKQLRRDPSPQGLRRDPSPQGLRRNPSPQPLRRDPSPQYLRRDPSPQGLRRDPSPQGLRRDPSPQGQRRDPSPKALRPSLSHRSSFEGLRPVDRFPPSSVRTQRLSKEFDQRAEEDIDASTSGRGPQAAAGRRAQQQRPVPQVQGQALSLAGHRAGVARQQQQQGHQQQQGPQQGTEASAAAAAEAQSLANLRRTTSAPGTPKNGGAAAGNSAAGNSAAGGEQQQAVVERSPSAGPSRLRYENPVPHPPGSGSSQHSLNREMTNSLRRKQIMHGQRRLSGAAAAIAELAEAGRDPSVGALTPPPPVRAPGVASLRSSSPSEAAPSPKAAPASRGAQMLVDALRSKDDTRLEEAINKLRGEASFGAAMGINDLHPVTGRTPLYEAVALGRLSLVQQLLDAGANTEVPHATQGPPLLHAAAWGETEIVDALLVAGACLGARDCAAYTALHLAAIGGHEGTVASLLTAGADTEAVNEEGHTPLDLAAGERMIKVLSQGPQEVAAGEPFAKSFGQIPADWVTGPAAGDRGGSEAQHAAPAPPSRPTSGRQGRPLSGAGRRFKEALGGLSASPSTSDDMSPPPRLHLPSKEEEDGMEGAPPLARCATPEGSPRGGGSGGIEAFGGAAQQPQADYSGSPPQQPPQRRLPTPKIGQQDGVQQQGGIIAPPGSGGLGAKPRRGMRPGSGGSGGSRTIGSPMAAQVAQRTATGLGINAGALQHQAAQMFYQSVEVKTGDIVWTRGELLGEGAYGKVYAGLNQLTGELMAVKVLPLNIGNGADAEEQRQHLANLEHELSLYRRFQHRHIVGYIATHMEFKTNTMYIFLEYVPGGSIASMLERFSAFSEELTRSFTRQLLLGLEYLHGCKVIHRDLKGGNVLVTRDGRVKLADFGASKAYHESTITDGMKSIRGSVFWMAPEVIKGTGYGRRADIWSVGCTVVEMLTGKHPWPELGDNHWTAMFQIAKTRSGPPVPEGTVSPVAQDFLAQCFKVDPRERPTVSELLQHPFVAHIPNAFREAEEAIDLNHSL